MRDFNNPSHKGEIQANKTNSNNSGRRRYIRRRQYLKTKLEFEEEKPISYFKKKNSFIKPKSKLFTFENLKDEEKRNFERLN